MPDPESTPPPRRRLSGLKPDALMAQGLASGEEELIVEVPGCEVETLLGRGGMGSVFLARQMSLDREVAVKVLASALADDPLFLERLEREARVMARLRHRNIVTVHDFQRLEDGSAAIVMQFIEGGSLRELLRRHPNGLPVADALRIIRQIAAGLRAAHEAGIVHRDMKPENVLIERDGTACVTDFGLALPMHGGTTRLTLTGTAVGTVDYMPPEQLRGQDVDARGDIFALGVILYELLTGQTPRGSFDAPHLMRPDVTKAVSLVVMKALRPVATDRFANVDAFLLALDACERRGHRSWWIIAACVMAVLASGAWWHISHPEQAPSAIEFSPWRDALAGVRIYDDVINGGWSKDKGVLTSNGNICSVILEREMPASYDVRLRFTRLSGMHSVGLFFTANSSVGVCDIDAWNEGLAGVQMISGQSLMDGYGFRFSLENGRSYEMLVEVRRDEVRVSVDGEFKKVFAIKGKTLDVPEPWGWKTAGRRLALGVGSYQSATRFDKVEWRELTTDPLQHVANP